MILIWRGWGLLAAVGFFLTVAAVGVLAKVKPLWLSPVAMFCSLLASGVFCVHYGTRWNRPVVRHSLYFLPLQVWGWIYFTLAAGQLLSSLAGILSYGFDQPGRMAQAVLAAVGLGVLTGAAFLVIRSSGRRQRVENLAFEDGMQGRFSVERSGTTVEV